MGLTEARKGIIFDIKEFAVFDGPGIRQTVFFKGCPLRCEWCHNPEGLCMEPQLMVSLSSCTHCGKCMEVCPAFHGAVAENEGTERAPLEQATPVMSTRPESCQACGACIPVCPLHLRRIAGQKMTSDELVEAIRKNSDYYATYGGGVTFSGGEPLLQADFLLEVLGKLPDLHRAIETSGYCEPKTFRKVVGELDYILMDIKLADRELHHQYTGVYNDKILENLKFLCSQDTPFCIRIPVIPGVNDNETNYRETAKLLKGAKALEKVELLPYHKTAGAKYEMVGRTYEPTFDTEQKIYLPEGIFEEYGISWEVL